MNEDNKVIQSHFNNRPFLFSRYWWAKILKQGPYLLLFCEEIKYLSCEPRELVKSLLLLF